MARIFISYRREDSAAYANRIYGWLKSRLPDGSVFMDVAAIAPGDNYVRVINREISSAHLLLAIIGNNWCISAGADGGFRLDKPDDLVRCEILTAINSGVRVVPVLVGGCSMPQKGDLPPSLHRIAKLNSITLGENGFEDAMKGLLALAELAADRKQQKDNDDRQSPSDKGPMIQRKICLLGVAGVGKTSLVRRYIQSIFSDSYLTTIGVKISKKVVSVGDQEVTLIIWDLEGEEEGHPIRANMVTGASGLILVADGCRATSLETAIGMRHRFAEGQIPAVLAVNKVDLHDEWQVDIDGLANQGYSGLTTFTTSAKTGKGVEEMFSYLVRKMLADDN
jgi:small GTP-binding protein